MKPYFSIIIPTLNEERYLPKLLEDLLNQTEKNFEVIVVDGKSTDKTIDVCKHFMKNIPSKIIISNKRNVAYQRNYGTKFSKGSYLFFLDADSRISNNFVYKLKKFIINNKGLLFIPYLTSGASDKKYRTLLDLSNMLAESSIFFDKKFSLGGSMIIEKNFFGLLGGFNENLYLAEDHELIQRAHFWGVSPRFLRNIKITASFRRFKNEGEIKILYKYIISTVYRLFSGEIKNKIFSYEMGGQVYKNKKIKKKGFNYYINEIEKLFNRIKDELKS